MIRFLTTLAPFTKSSWKCLLTVNFSNRSDMFGLWICIYGVLKKNDEVSVILTSFSRSRKDQNALEDIDIIRPNLMD